jgi:hypothetical protein
MNSVGTAVPACQRLAIGSSRRLDRIPLEDSIAALDVLVVVHYRLGHGLVAPGADLPLQKANPKHQLGQSGGALALMGMPE